LKITFIKMCLNYFITNPKYGKVKDEGTKYVPNERTYRVKPYTDAGIKSTYNMLANVKRDIGVLSKDGQYYKNEYKSTIDVPPLKPYTKTSDKSAYKYPGKESKYKPAYTGYTPKSEYKPKSEYQPKGNGYNKPSTGYTPKPSGYKPKGGYQPKPSGYNPQGGSSGYGGSTLSYSGGVPEPQRPTPKKKIRNSNDDKKDAKIKRSVDVIKSARLIKNSLIGLEGMIG